MSTQRLVALAFGASVLLLQNVSPAQTPSGNLVTVSADDRKFILEAGQSGVHEVKMGMLGVEHGTNNDVRVYAQRMLDDHTLSNAQVVALARLKGITLPDPTKTDETVERLSRLVGIEFDREFIRAEIDDHLKNLTEFEKEDRAGASDQDIQGFAHSALPKMHEHMDQAKALKL